MLAARSNTEQCNVKDFIGEDLRPPTRKIVSTSAQFTKHLSNPANPFRSFFFYFLRSLISICSVNWIFPSGERSSSSRPTFLSSPQGVQCVRISRERSPGSQRETSNTCAPHAGQRFSITATLTEKESVHSRISPLVFDNGKLCSAARSPTVSLFPGGVQLGRIIDATLILASLYHLY